MPETGKILCCNDCGTVLETDELTSGLYCDFCKYYPSMQDVFISIHKIYFGHPINVYNTELEKILVREIYRTFPSWGIENPNQKHHSEGYERYKKETGKGMDYYFNEVLPHCRAGIFLPFRDGKYGAGVFKEAEFIAKNGYPIWAIHADRINKISPKEMEALSVDGTKARIRDASGNLIPY